MDGRWAALLVEHLILHSKRISYGADLHDADNLGFSHWPALTIEDVGHVLLSRMASRRSRAMLSNRLLYHSPVEMELSDEIIELTVNERL